MLRAIGITIERLVAAEVEFLCCRLTMRPLAGAERRRSMVKQTRDVKNFLIRSAHASYPIQQNTALHNYEVRRSVNFKRNNTIYLNQNRIPTEA